MMPVARSRASSALPVVPSIHFPLFEMCQGVLCALAFLCLATGINDADAIGEMLMLRLPLTTREEAIALFDQDELHDEKPIDAIVTHAYQMQDFYMHDDGGVPYIDAYNIIGTHRFHWLEMRTQAWTLRVELETPGNEHPRFRLYKLIWREEGQELLVETLAFDDLFKCGVPIVGAQVLAVVNRDDFLSFEHHVGRVHVRLQPKAIVPKEEIDRHLKRA